MLKVRYPFYLANQPDYRNTNLEVTDKYTGKVVCHVAMANRTVIDQAIAAAVKAGPNAGAGMTQRFGFSQAVERVQSNCLNQLQKFLGRSEGIRR